MRTILSYLNRTDLRSSAFSWKNSHDTVGRQRVKKQNLIGVIDSLNHLSKLTWVAMWMVCLFLVFLVPGIAFGQYIDIRISIKIIVHETTGNRPNGITDKLFYDAAEAARQWQASYSRGYRFRIIEILEIGGPLNGGADGPSKWFGIRPTDDAWSDFQDDVRTDARYKLRANQVNFYVTAGPTSNPGGACPIPPGETHLTACHGLVNDGPWWMNHELGHFFGLAHPFAGENNALCTPGDDGIADTLPDSTCWTSQDDVANATYQMNYDDPSMTSNMKKMVDDVYFNVMSYHEANNKDIVENRMTELQLDYMADIANSDRNAFVSGKTWFVKPGTVNAGDGSSTDEYQLISQAVAAASGDGGDILLFRPGVYQQNLTISKPLTLRATRVGEAIIGQ